jgi:hypothetical protein
MSVSGNWVEQQMIELVVNLGDKNMKNQVDVSFYVGDDVPQLSSSWPKNLGTWNCRSELLGKRISGQYWMGNLKLPSCADHELSHLACDRRPLANPVAFFSDSGESLPFLILYGFDPKGSGWRHGDKFFRDKLNRIEGVFWATRSGLVETERLRKEALEQLRR